MAIVEKITIRKYRSVCDEVEIRFPRNKPIVLVGENNAGKSNIVKGIELVLGERWPGSHEPEDHEFFNRTRTEPIDISIYFEDTADGRFGRYRRVRWCFDPNSDDDPLFFRGYPGQRGRQSGWVSNDDRDTCMCIVIGSDRNLDYQLSYRSKWTFLSRLMKKFHGALLAQEDTKLELEGIFEEIKDKFYEVEPFARFSQSLQDDFEDLLGSMTHRLQVDFQAYNPVNFFHALELHAVEGDSARTIDELGTGEEQLLAIAFAHAYAQAFHGGILLIIEEPEAHLHPLMQRWLSRRIHQMAQDGLQIVVTTHSPAFIDILNLDRLILVRKDVQEGTGGTQTTQLSREELVQRCVQTGVPAQAVNEDNILPFYSANATQEILEGFFAKSVVLVEGPTESLALPVYLRKAGTDTLEHGIAVISVGGKGNLAKWWRLFTAYGIPTYVIFDNDDRDDGNGNRRRDALRALGIDDADAEHYIAIQEWTTITPTFSVFGQDFEAALRELFDGYEELEDEAQGAIGSSSKPLIARYVARRLDYEQDHQGWSKFEELAELILQTQV